MILDAVRVVVVAEAMAIFALTLRIVSLYAALLSAFPKERRLLPQHVIWIGMGTLTFVFAKTAEIAGRFGESDFVWYAVPAGLVACTTTLVALVMMARHEEREWARVVQLRRDAQELTHP